MVRRNKHKGQLERWAQRALRGSLLAGAIAVMLITSGGPQKVAAEDSTDMGPQEYGGIREQFSYVPLDGYVPAVDSADPANKLLIAQIHKQLEAKAAATCPMCGKPLGACCCGGSDKCTCGK